MPRWPSGYVRKNVCPSCGGRMDYEAKLCRKCAPPNRGLLGKKGAEHPAWKGTGIVDRDGYLKTYAPEHPWPRRGGYVRENVRRMELKIGRRIRKDEVVHHIDEDRANNADDNLELKERGIHSREHRLRDTYRRRRDSGGRFAP
jgi:ribosomal protein L40E